VTYSTLLERDSVKGRFLAILNPRRRVETWTIVSGFVYEADFSNFPKPIELYFNGTEMNKVLTSTPNASEWYYEETTKKIRLRTPQSEDPDNGQAVATYPIYVATSGGDSNWFSNPLDDSSESLHYDAVISQPPQIKSTVDDILFGFLPVQSSSITLINSEHFLEKHIYDSSFNQGSIKIYHAIGDSLKIEDISLIYDGLMSDLSYSSDKLTIKMKDRIDEFSSEYRNKTKSFFNTSDFPTVNPNFIGKAIRYIWGIVDGFIPVCTTYLQDEPTTSNNRTWLVMNETTGISDISRTIGGGVHTTTKTFLNFAEGITVGDTIWLDRSVGIDEFITVTNVNYTPAFLEHIAISGAMSNGDFAKKSFVSRVEIVQDSKKYLAMFGRDYLTTHTLGSSTCSGFIFTNNFEASLSMTTLTPNDQVSCRVYGRENDLTGSAVSFGSNDALINNITNPVMIIYDIMKNRMKIPESRINLVDFETIRSELGVMAIGMAIPRESTSGFKSYKNVILDILQSALLRIVIGTDLKWTLKRLKPLVTALKTIDKEEIFDGLDIEYDYTDILSDILIEYDYREVAEDLSIFSFSTKQVTAESNYARYTHKVSKQGTFESLHFRSTDAQILANRLSYVLGDRSSKYEIKTRNRFFDSMINDTITVTTNKLPGFDYVATTDRSRDLVIKSVTKGLKGVSLDADDQKGIQDNQASW